MLRYATIALTIAMGVTILIVLITARSTVLPTQGKQDITAANPDMLAARGLPEPFGRLADSGAAAVLPEKTMQTATRNVGGGMIAAPAESGEALQRIEALPQPTPPPLPKPPEPVKPRNFMRWKLVYNSVITAAGVFDLNGASMVLPDIDIVSAGETCTAPNGKVWPCGTAARTAFRNFVKGRAITCKLPDVPPQESHVAECRLHGRDMAEWLVEQGWARAKPQTLYVDREIAAKGYRRGIFGNPPPGVETVNAPESGPPGPAEQPANP